MSSESDIKGSSTRWEALEKMPNLSEFPLGWCEFNLIALFLWVEFVDSDRRRMVNQWWWLFGWANCSSHSGSNCESGSNRTHPSFLCLPIPVSPSIAPRLSFVPTNALQCICAQANVCLYRNHLLHYPQSRESDGETLSRIVRRRAAAERGHKHALKKLILCCHELPSNVGTWVYKNLLIKLCELHSKWTPWWRT